VPGEARSGRPAARDDAPSGGNRRGGPAGGRGTPPPKPAAAPANSAFADAFSRALKK